MATNVLITGGTGSLGTALCLRMQGDKRSDVKELCAGDIGVLVGLKESKSGDTICSQDNKIVLENIARLSGMNS